MIKIYKDWNFPESQYIREATEKRQIVLHHTVSGDLRHQPRGASAPMLR